MAETSRRKKIMVNVDASLVEDAGLGGAVVASHGVDAHVVMRQWQKHML